MGAGKVSHHLIILLPMYAISAEESEYASAPAEPASRD
jgi:hypothetical protein